MTNEEAKTLIKSALKTMYLPKSKEYISDLGYALEIAIKALEQEPCEDAIGRSDMLDAIGHGTTYTSEELQRIIKALPPVNPQQKRGHWIRISMDKYSKHAKYWYRCDRCCKDNLGDTDWCPSCGARMG